MMMKQSKLTLLALVVLFIFPLGALAKRKPAWVKQRPNDPAYYIGLATVAKSGSAVSYRQVARDAALKQMSSEIKVSISSNSVLHKLESDADYKEAYESKVQASVQQTLEGYEVLTWENRKEYWVMTRLSKEKYARARQMKLDRAKMMASAYLSDARKALSGNDAYSALNYLAKGVISLRNHLEEDLNHKTVDGTYNVGTALFSTIQDVLRRIELVPVQPRYQIRFSQKLTVPIGLHAYLRDTNGSRHALTGLPLNAAFSKGEGLLSLQHQTDASGYTAVSVTRLLSKRKMQEFTVALDFSAVVNAESDPEVRHLLSVFFPQKQMPTVGISIEVMKSKAYLLSTETVFGAMDQKGVFSGMLKTELNENFFTFTSNQEEADFEVTINTNFVAGDERKGQGYAVYTVFADLSIGIKDVKAQTEIFTDQLNGIRGMRPGNFEYALKDARIKLINAFQQEIEPRLEQVDM